MYSALMLEKPRNDWSKSILFKTSNFCCSDKLVKAICDGYILPELRFIVFIIVSMKPYFLFVQCLGYYSAHQGWSVWITEKMATFFFCAEIEARSSLLYDISCTLSTSSFFPSFFFFGWNKKNLFIEWSKSYSNRHAASPMGFTFMHPIIRLGEQEQKELDKALREEARFFAKCIFLQILFGAFW